MLGRVRSTALVFLEVNGGRLVWATADPIWEENGQGEGRKAFSDTNTQMLVAFLHLAQHLADTSKPQLAKQGTMVLQHPRCGTYVSPWQSHSWP